MKLNLSVADIIEIIQYLEILRIQYRENSEYAFLCSEIEKLVEKLKSISI